MNTSGVATLRVGSLANSMSHDKLITNARVFNSTFPRRLESQTDFRARDSNEDESRCARPSTLLCVPTTKLRVCRLLVS